MASIDEILATMPEPTAEGDHEYLTIDPATRVIHVPESEKIFGVTGDELADRKYFICPRIVGDGLDLSAMFIRVNFRNANGEEDGYLVNDVAVSGDYVTFSWQLWPKVAAYQGEILFSVCADLPNTPDRRMPDWSTTLASGEVLEGLRPYDGYVEDETSDVVTQLRAETAAQTAAVEATGASQVQTVEAAGAAATADAKAQIEAKGEAVRASIPADYSTLAGKVNEFANAIKGNLSGEIVQAGDVSPVEHYPAVRIHGKNLLPYPYTQATYTGNGATFTAQEDGGVLCEGTPTDYASLNLYSGVPLFKSGGLVFSASGDYENVNISMVIYDADRNVLFTKETWKGGPVISVILDDYPTAASWLVFVKRGTPNVEMTGTLYPQMELGATATEYTPYIDPAGVTVTRCGKNLIDYKKPILSYSVESSEINNGLHLTGRYMASFPVNIPAGSTVTMAWNKANTEGSVVDVWRVQYADTTYSAYCNSGAAMVTQLPVAQVCLYVNKGDADGAADFTNIQLELGEAATAYESYNGATAMPDESGVVTGLPSLAPTMTLLTDTAGVVIDCEYNRDINAVLADILEKIAALSG